MSAPKPKADEAIKSPSDWLPSEALYAFTGWLTSRKERSTFSGCDDAAPAATLVDRFCRRNGLEPPRDSAGWNRVAVPAEDNCAIAPIADNGEVAE